MSRYASILTPIRLIAPALALVAAGFLFFSSAGRDDAHITYWAAYGLSKFGEIANYNGARVEQSSSLWHVVLLALANRLTGIDLVVLGKWSSILFGAACVFGIHQLALRILPREAYKVAILVALCPIFVYWSFGGLEATLAALAMILYALTAGQLVSHGKYPLAALGALIFAGVRPEFPLVMAACIAGAWMFLLINKLATRRTLANYREVMIRLAALTLINFAIIGALFWFRKSYFGDYFPQPVNAKTGALSLDDLRAGLSYLRDNLLVFPAFIFTALAVAGGVYAAWIQSRSRNINYFLVFVLILAGTHAAFIAIVGGDWMEAGRFIVAVAPFWMLLACLPLAALREPRVLVVSFVLLIAFQLGGLMNLASTVSTGMPAWDRITLAPDTGFEGYSWFEQRNRVNLRDMLTIEHLDGAIDQVGSYKQGPVYVLTSQMGMVPYYSTRSHFGKVVWLDRKSLVDRTFTTCAITRNWDRDSNGALIISYQKFMRNLQILTTVCNIPRPDIIFDLGGAEAQLAGYGYTTVFRQTGSVLITNGWLPGQPIAAREFIAVSDIYPQVIAGLPLLEVKFPSLKR